MSAPYTFEERVLVVGDDKVSTDTVVRLDTHMEWGDAIVHPFGSISEWLSVSPSSSNTMSDSNEGGFGDIQVTMSLASSASQSLSQEGATTVPLLGRWLVPTTKNSDNNATTVIAPDSQSWAQFPAGFHMEITTTQRALTATELQDLVNAWIDRRLITTPLEGTKWHYQSYQDGSTSHRLYLPTTGEAWSADALQQSFSNLIPSCSRPAASEAFFMGLSSMEWSKLLVDGWTQNKQMWWKFDRHQATVGMQFQPSMHLLHTSSKPNNNQLFRWSQVLPKIASQQPFCPLAQRSVQQSKSGELSGHPLTANLEQVVRRPWPNKGRLETWLSTDTHDSDTSRGDDSLTQCQFTLRQVLPTFITPVWQSLELISDDTSNQANDGPRAMLEYDNDGSSILSVVSEQMSSSLLVTLDYDPAFLCIDDFPGDPNRGRELPPAVLTLTCPQAIHVPQPTYQLYSNPLLLLPPVPDMSMPFNVISLTCSLYAYVVGTIVTLLVKKASEKVRYKLHPEEKPPSKLQILKSKVLAKFRRSAPTSSTEENKATSSDDAGGNTKKQSGQMQGAPETSG